MKNRQKRLALLLCTTITMSVFSGCGQKEEEVVTEEVATVDMSNPEIGDLSLSGSFVATINPDDTVNVIPLTTGEVLTVNVEEGDMVSEGDVLATIDDTTAQISLQTAQIQANTAQLTYNLSYGDGANLLNEMNSDTTITSQEDAISDLQDNLVTSMDMLEHYQSMLKSSEDELKVNQNEYGYNDEVADIYDYALTFDKTDPDEAEDYANAMDRYSVALKRDTQIRGDITKYKAYVEQYEESVETIENSIDDTYEAYAKSVVADDITNGELRNDQKQMSQNTITSANLGVQNAQRALDNCIIKATTSGKVEAVNLDEHNMASAGQTAFVISCQDVMKATFYVSEEVRNSLELGQPINMEKDGVTYNAEITDIDDILDTTTGLFKVNATISGDVSKLLTGTKVTITTDTYRAKDSLIIPYDAVYFQSGSAYVYTVVDGVAKKTMVETGLYDDTSIVITSGLTKDDVVVTTWSAQLRDGVKVQSPDAEAATDSTESTTETTSAAAQE